MNAHALLASQGWRGTGHTLHPTDNSIGLSRPLLLSRKDNKLGIGQKPHYTSDQWWLNAFDQKLKGLDTSKRGVIVQTVTQGKLDAVAVGGGKYSGLYATFVKGGLLEGTITPDESTDTTPSGEDAERPPASPTERGIADEERRARKEAKRLRKAQKEAQRVAESAGNPMETGGCDENEAARSARKSERRARKEEKRRRKEERRRPKAAG